MKSSDGQNRVGAGTVSDERYSDRVRYSTREDGPDGSGRMRVHQRSRSLMEVNSSCANRCFRLRRDHWPQTKEQALRLFLSWTWSMMWSISSCGNPDMMVVVVQQYLLVSTFKFNISPMRVTHDIAGPSRREL